MKFVERGTMFLLLVAALFAAHQVAAVTFSLHGWEFPKSGDWATWFGAAGTAAALFSAIYIAREETRQRHAHERSLARISASALWLLIPEASATIKRIRRDVAEAEEGSRSPDWERIAALLASIELWSEEDLVRMATSKNHAAAQLAFAKAEIRISAKKCASMAPRLNYILESERTEFESEMRLRVERMGIYLNSGFDGCNEILLGWQH